MSDVGDWENVQPNSNENKINTNQSNKSVINCQIKDSSYVGK